MTAVAVVIFILLALAAGHSYPHAAIVAGIVLLIFGGKYLGWRR